MNSMRWLVSRMIDEIKDVKRMTYQKEEQLKEKYAKMIDIQTKVKYGSVYAIEDFIEDVEAGNFIPYDGHGKYWDEEKQAKKYKYVIWYNK